MTDNRNRDDLSLDQTSDWEYLHQQHDDTETSEPSETHRRRRSWRRHKFASLDTKSWDQAKQTISKASKMLRRRIPQSGHLMTAKKFWLQTVPCNDCDIVVTFPPDTCEATVLWFQQKLRQIQGLNVNTRNLNLSSGRFKLASCFAFQITASYPVFLRGLEEMHIPKLLKEELGGGNKEFSLADGGHFVNIEDAEKFLTSADRQSILLHFLNSIRAEKEDVVGDVTFREGEAIVPKCLSKGVLWQIYPLHDNICLENLQKTWVKQIFGLQPLDKISEYFGIKIAFYFSWLGHYTSALTVPALVGLLFWIFFKGKGEFMDDIGFVIFSFFNVIWATLYLESWKRRSAELSHQWGTIDTKSEMLSEPRVQYQGEERLSEVTGKPEPHYPAWKRNIFRYFVTAPVIMFSLLTVFLTGFLILELQQWVDGMIKDKQYIQFLSYIPKILLAIIIPIFDDLYHKVAVWLNDMENYKIEADYENHFIFKISVFQFVNSFLALFYTAFYLQDIEKLKELLAALLITRQVVGNVKESLIPYAKKQLKLAKMSFDLFGALSPTTSEPDTSVSDASENHKKTDGDDNDEEPRSSGPRQVSQVEVEGSTPQYEGTFDDYLEMFIQFGYVTLFSSAYPLAGLCALFNNLIEVRSDAFKLCFIHQRPFPERVQNIGCWQTAMEIMGVIGVIVNCALIGLSGPVHRMFPDMTPAQTVILIIVLEHVMLLLKFLISAAIPDIPHHVEMELARTEYKRREVERLITHQRVAELQTCTRMDSKDSLSPPTSDPVLEDKQVQCDFSVDLNEDSLFREYNNGDILTEDGQAEFKAVVSTMRPNQVFNYKTRSRTHSLRSQESPSRRSSKSGNNNTVDGSEEMIMKGEDTMTTFIPKADSPDSLMMRKHSENSALRARMRQFTSQRQASDSSLLRNMQLSEFQRPSHGSRQDLSPSEELPEKIIINDVPTPPFPLKTSSKSGPTPPDKRILDQKEFDKKLKAKRLFFAKGRSMSLASFKISSRLRKSSASPKKAKYWDKERDLAENQGPPRGELDFLNMDQLVNVTDLEAEMSSSNQTQNSSPFF